MRKPPKSFTYECEEITPALRRVPAAERNQVWMRWYDKLVVQLEQGPCRFINYGYLGRGNRPPGPDAIFVELYQWTLAGTDLAGKRVLEVGSGLGGGALWLAQTHQSASVVGVDLSTEAVRSCRERYSDQPNLRFVAGDSEALPFPDASFDVVCNVESSHCYANFDAFLAEVHRVLVPGGLFCWSDFQRRAALPELESGLVDSGFTIVALEDITEGVLRCLEFVRAGVAAGTLDGSRFIWAGDVDCVQDVIDEFSDWRSYHAGRLRRS